MDAADLERVYEAFEDFHAYFAPVFGHKESREHSRHYLPGLLVQSQERRNAENLAETVPASPRALPRFLTASPWDDEGVIGRLQEYLGSRLADPQAVWVLDGSDFPKQGVKSVGVIRQYCGALGKIANCQAGLFLAHVGPRGRALVDKRLYLPQEWTSDVERCAAAGVPEARREYRSKTALALEMLEGAWARGYLKAQWVAGDSAFGMSPTLREGVSAHGTYYVMDVRPDLTVWPLEPAWSNPPNQGNGRPRKPRLRREERQTMAQRSPALPAAAWREITIAMGSQGAARLPLQRPAGTGNAAAQTWRSPLGGLSPEHGRQRTPLLPVQRSRGHPLGNPGPRGRLPVAHRNRVRDGEERCGIGRVRDPHLGGLASSHRHVPAGRSLPADPAAGLGGKRCL